MSNSVFLELLFYSRCGGEIVHFEIMNFSMLFFVMGVLIDDVLAFGLFFIIFG